MTNQDITQLLYRIKESIRDIEGGDANTSALGEVRADFLELIELLKLFLISQRDSYYGYFLMNMQFHGDFSSRSIAGIRLNTFPPLFVANPLLLCKFSLKEILFIVCHEIDHVLLNHPAEMVKANPTGDSEIFNRFNLAADAAVNDRIAHEIDAEKHGFLSMPEGAITSKALAQMFSLGRIRTMENYAYYFDLIRDKESDGQKNGQDAMMEHRNEKDGVPEEKDRQGGGAGQEEQTAESGGENGEIVTAADCCPLRDHDWQAGDDPEDVAAATRELVNAAVGMMSEETRGLMPGHFMSQVEKLNRPPVLSWQAILKKYVGTISVNKRKTRMRLNRRQPERFDLSGRVDDKVLKIVVAIDTSASVSDEMIARIFNEIFAILAKRRHEVTVIECDTAVRRVYRAQSPDDVRSKVTGRGGTRFSPVIEYINKDGYFRDALLIYFTDGYGESEIPRPRTYRNMWVVIDNGKHLSVKEPYGVVLSLGESEGER